MLVVILPATFTLCYTGGHRPRTWRAVLSGKVKSLPQVPGKFWLPNSAPDSSTPRNLQPPVAAGAFEVVALGWDAEVELGLVVEVDSVVAALPGRHCEYHWLEYVHVYPDTHVVAPVHPWPPHCA
jgi:hypothetical protein